MSEFGEFWPDDPSLKPVAVDIRKRLEGKGGDAVRGVFKQVDDLFVKLGRARRSGDINTQHNYIVQIEQAFSAVEQLIGLDRK